LKLKKASVKRFDIVERYILRVAGAASVVVCVERECVDIFFLENALECCGDTNVLCKLANSFTAAARYSSCVIASTPVTPIAIAMSLYFSPVHSALYAITVGRSIAQALPWGVS
jgi:hypothetical protein